MVVIKLNLETIFDGGIQSSVKTYLKARASGKEVVIHIGACLLRLGSHAQLHQFLPEGHVLWEDENGGLTLPPRWKGMKK